MHKFSKRVPSNISGRIPGETFEKKFTIESLDVVLERICESIPAETSRETPNGFFEVIFERFF